MTFDFKSFIPTVKAMLGIEEFEATDGVKALTAAQRQSLVNFGFPESFANNFEAALNDTKASAAGNEGINARMAVVSAALAQTTEQLNKANEEIASLKAQGESAGTALAAKEKALSELQARVTILANEAEVDPASAPKAATGNGFDALVNDEKQLGGKAGVMYAMDRAYNQRARASLLASRGFKAAAPIESSTDYSTLTEDLGAFFRQTWRDRLQSLLVTLPSVESIWPLESGYQDLATLVNVWLGDFSQADNSIGSSFDNVVKGSYEFGTETLRMSGVMFAHKFNNMAAIERTWIGQLNREGSDPIKLSFIEFLLAETSKKLHNERELRRVNGVRRNPNLNEPGSFLEAADGFYEFIRKKVDGHIDFTVDGGTTGKKVYQVKPFELGEITEGNIGEVIYKGTSMIPAHVRDSGKLILYIPSYMLVQYHKYNEAKYGTNQDYQGGLMTVKEYPTVKIVPVPHADEHCRLVWTVEGNIKCYEQAAGEMYKFKLEQQDWSLKVRSHWKEGLWAEAVGYKYTDDNKDQMGYDRQMIFCNEYDRPATSFITAAPGVNPSAAVHNSITVSGNYAITDILDVEVGATVRIKAGAPGVTIAKEGKFTAISAEWAPKTGDVIVLVKKADGGFIEVKRQSANVAAAYMFAADAVTPSVAGASVFVCGENTKATVITDLKDGEVGVTYTIYGNGDANASTIANGGKFVLSDAMTLGKDKQIKLLLAQDGKYYEISRV